MAFQFNTALTQKEVIGEWVPISDPEQSRVINSSGDKEWVPDSAGKRSMQI